VLSTLCVDRAVPSWGKVDEGHASDKALNTTLLSEIAHLLAQYGVHPGASIYMADAALVPEENLAALGDPLCITRLPATYNACERVMAEAVARNQWEEVGVVAQTPPPKHRPGTCYTVAESSVTLYGQPYRAVVGPSSSQDQRRQKALARERQASYTALEATVREAAHQEYCCRAAAEAAAAKRRAPQSAYHRVDVMVEEPPTSGPGWPRQKQPRVVKAWRYGLKATLHERAEVIAHKVQELGCFVLLTNVPTAGEMAPSAGEVLRAYKEQHGVEQNFAFLKDPIIVNSLCLKKPERMEALGLVLWLALLLWRLVERALRVHVETPGSPWTGWAKKATQKPTAFMLMTKFAAVIIVKVGAARQLAQPFAAVQQASLSAGGVPAPYLTVPLRRCRGQEEVQDDYGRGPPRRPDLVGEGQWCGRHATPSRLHLQGMPTRGKVHTSVRQKAEESAQGVAPGMVRLEPAQV